MTEDALTPDAARVGAPARGARSRDDGARRRAATDRWLVHLGLIAMLVISLLFEPVLTLHILVGLLFVLIVVSHLWQRRRTSASLLARLARPGVWPRPGGRLALADAALLAITGVMLGSGFWDWLNTRTSVRWHAPSGVLLGVVTVVHTVRRRRRLRGSVVK